MVGEDEDMVNLKDDKNLGKKLQKKRVISKSSMSLCYIIYFSSTGIFTAVSVPVTPTLESK